MSVILIEKIQRALLIIIGVGHGW